MGLFSVDQLLQKTFWLKAWAWSKANWKFLLGLAIPIAISVFLRRGKAAEILAKAREVKAKQLAVEIEAIEKQAHLREQALKDHGRAISNAEEERAKAIADLQERADEIKKSIDEPAKATEAIADRFNIENLDKE